MFVLTAAENRADVSKELSLRFFQVTYEKFEQDKPQNREPCGFPAGFTTVASTALSLRNSFWILRGEQASANSFVLSTVWFTPKLLQTLHSDWLLQNYPLSLLQIEKKKKKSIMKRGNKISWLFPYVSFFQKHLHTIIIHQQ